MNEQILAAEGGIQIGQHTELTIGPLAFNLETIIGALIAAAAVLGLGFLVRAKLSSGTPNSVQLVFETTVNHVRSQVDSFVGIRVAPYLVPVGMALFVFLVACNWIVVLPVHSVLEPPTADVNVVYALAALMLVWWHTAGVRAQRGPGRYTMHVVKGHYAPFAPMWIIEEVVHPTSLALRLFGNIFAGGIMISLLALLPSYISWAPTAGWKLFDMAIGLLQAYLFMLLTISYFGQATEDREHAH